MKLSEKGTKLVKLDVDAEGIILPDAELIQISMIGDYYFAEIVVDAELYNSSTKNAKEQKEDEEYQNALEIVLNKDPKPPYRWSGKKLCEILENDKDWMIWAYHNLYNKFVLPAVKLICEKNNLE